MKVPAPPAGVIFNGWTITGGSYSANGGLANPILNVSLNSAASYTLTAKFTYGGVREYRA